MVLYIHYKGPEPSTSLDFTVYFMQDLRWDAVTLMYLMKHTYVFASHGILKALSLESDMRDEMES